MTAAVAQAYMARERACDRGDNDGAGLEHGVGTTVAQVARAR